MKWIEVATMSPLPITAWIVSMAKEPWLASIIPPSIAKTASRPLCSPENRLAPGWCQTIPSSRSSPTLGKSPVRTAWKYSLAMSTFLLLMTTLLMPLA